MLPPINCANILAKTHCITSHRGKSLSVSGQDTILTFVNENCDLLIKFDIDCLLDEYHAAPPYDFKRCDFMVKHKNTNYYVELKKGDYRGACNQIASAIKKLNKCFGGEKCKAIVVVFFPNKVPVIAGFQEEIIESRINQHLCEAAKIIVAPDASYPLS